MTLNKLRPKIHFTAKDNWLNDPNGLSYYNGEYHLFYQHNPYGVAWGNMSWGHAVSKDLVAFEHRKVALWIEHDYERDGVFSGSAIVKDGKHYLYYTGVKKEDGGLRQVQCMAMSEDGTNYVKYEGNPIVVGDEIHADPFDFRDPKVWEHQGALYMIVATKDEKGGKAVIYKSMNRVTFEYFTCFRKEGAGYMWECPDYFKVGNQEILVFSGIDVEDGPQKNIAYAGQVSLDYASKNTVFSGYEKMDYGIGFYAPQSMEDNKGRRIVIGWMVMDKPFDAHHSFTGMMTLPRAITMKEGHICYFPIEEIYQDKEKLLGNDALKCYENTLEYVLEDFAYEINVKFSRDKVVKLSFDHDRVVIEVNRKTGKIQLLWKECNDIQMVKESPVLDEEVIDLHVIVDISIIEIYVNGGRFVLSKIIENGFINKTLKISEVENLCDFSLFKLDVKL